MAVGEDAFSVPVCFRRRARDSAPYLQPARGRARCPYRAASPFKTVGFCLLFLLAAALCSTALAADKKIVLIAGSRSHGSGEHEFRAGDGQFVGQGPAAEIAEHEACAGPRRRGNGIDGPVDGRHGGSDLRHLEEHKRGDKGRGKRDGRLPHRHRAPALADRPGDGQ